MTDQVNQLHLSPDELLSTTRAVGKRLDFDHPLDLALVRECLELALQAPNGGNGQNWHFVLVTDPEKKTRLANIYRKGWAIYSSAFHDLIPSDEKPLAQQGITQKGISERMAGSGDYLARNMHRAPVLLIPCFAGRVDHTGENASLMQASQYGSLLPAVWSFMLAARSRGLGTCWTTLHLFFEAEAANVLEIPYESVTQAAMIPVAHILGDAFHRAPRVSLDEVLHMNRW
jgi:nitroreductase